MSEDKNNAELEDSQQESQALRVLAIVGPTASGKSALGIEVARRLGGEIAGLSFCVELTALGGRAKLGEFAIHTLLAY